MTRPRDKVMFTDDLKPDLVVELSATTSGEAVDATAATTVRVHARKNGAVLFSNRVPTVTSDGTTSVVTMAWQSGDTTTEGRIEVEVEVTWPGSKPQTFRAGNAVVVLPDIA